MRLPRVRPTVRLRLTLVYSGLFLVAGAALLTVNYELVSHRFQGPKTITQVVSGSGGISSAFGIQQGQPPEVLFQQGAAPGGPGPVQSPISVKQMKALQDLGLRVQDHTLHTLLVESLLALGLMAVASVGLGWLAAGRVLKPVHRITDTARRLSEETLDQRIGLEGPDDELKELADTFDAMLARLDTAFTSQRRFVANASHDLRTPLATERVLIDEGLANRGAGIEDLRQILEQLRANSTESEQLIDSLLMLARSERGVERWRPADLASLAARVAERSAVEALTTGVEIRTDLQPAPAAGDPALLERLAGNLVDNAVRHNLQSGGWVEITTGARGGRPWLRVINSGRVLDPKAVPGLFEPFRRDAADRTVSDAGVGLGLSIVEAAVRAHRGALDVIAPPSGGLDITVRLPPARPVAESDTTSTPATGRPAGSAKARRSG